MTKFILIFVLALVACTYAQEQDDTVITEPTVAPTEATDATTEATEATAAPTEATVAPTEATAAPTETTAAPTEAETTAAPAAETTPAPRGSTIAQITAACKEAHKNDSKADILIDSKTCKATCASIDRRNFLFFFQFEIIRRYNDPATDLADGEKCTEQNVCLAGSCVPKSTADACQANGSPVKAVESGECQAKCTLENGETQSVNINEGRDCGRQWFQRCKKGTCKNIFSFKK